MSSAITPTSQQARLAPHLAPHLAPPLHATLPAGFPQGWHRPEGTAEGHPGHSERGAKEAELPGQASIDYHSIEQGITEPGQGHAQHSPGCVAQGPCGLHQQQRP